MTVSGSKARRINSSLKYSVLDGAAFSAMLGLTQEYIVPFALALGAATGQVGLLASIPNLTMALSQLVAPMLTRKAGSRKGLILPVVFLHALMWLPIMLTPYLFPSQGIWWLIAFYTLCTVFGSLGNPAWGSMMADLVSEETRGRYFGFRGRIAGLVTLVFFFIGGAILQFSKANVLVGFSMLFGGAMLFRFLSWYYLSRMYEPHLSRKRERHDLLETVKTIGSSNLGKFTIYVSLLNFATFLAGPFFAVYMLRELKFSYLTYVAIIATAAVANMLFLTFWGKRADRAGNLKVIKIASAFITFLPMLWLGGNQPSYLIPVQVISGFAWAGFNLASMNFIYDASAREERTQYIAVFNAMNGVAICLGALLGGYLAPILPPIMGQSLLTLFLLSGILRGLATLLLLPRVKEVRQVPTMSAASLLLGRLRRAGPRELPTREVHATPKI